jgi:hypothetical protein
MKMEAEYVPETWVNIYLSTQYQMLEEFSLQKHQTTTYLILCSTFFDNAEATRLA